jgi:predicted branched-subunit amino acid permease
LLLTACTLNLRHLVMGAVLRPRIGGSPLRRAGLAFFLLDESFGFAVAAGDAGEDAARMLRLSGIALYVAWQTGTVLGILGAGRPEVAGVAGAIFPVLFIGLAALACRTRSQVLRAVGAALLTAALAVALPDWRALAPLAACIVVSVPGAGE